MKRVPTIEKPKSKPSTAKQRTELKALASLPADKIDTSDSPEVRDWSGAKRGLFTGSAK